MPLVIALVVLPTASSSVRIWAPCGADVAGHLGDALGVVGDRSEGVHRDDDADGGQQSGAGQCHREQRDGQRRATQQVGTEHGGADDQGGVDRRLEADREAGEDHGGRAGQRGLADVLDRTVLGAGVVPGQREDAGGHHDADDHGERRDHPRVPVRTGDAAGVVEVGEAAGQVDERQEHGCHRGDGRRDVERAVDRLQAVLAGPGLAQVDTGDRRQRADRGDQQREDQSLVAERLRPEDQRGDQRHGVRLEEVGRHAGAVADVVADVVGDGRGVARVVLGDVLLDLADQVGAHVGGLGEDAAADSHEHREQRRTEAEALEHLGRLVLEQQDHDAGAEQAQTDRQHADHRAGPEADVHRRVATGLVGRGGHPEVGADGEGHPEVADRAGEAGADQEEHRPEDPDRGVVGGQREQREERHAGEDGEGPELPGQVGARALLHRLGDVLHVVGALTGGHDLLTEHRRHRERAQRDQCDDDDQDEVSAGDVHDEGIDPRHVFPPASSRE